MGEAKDKVSGQLKDRDLNLIGLLFIFLLISSQSLWSQDFSEGDVDYIGLAKVLIRDANFSRAEKMLIKGKKEGDAEPGEIEALEGMIQLHRKKYKESKASFLTSLKKGQKSPEIYLYLAEAELHLGNLSAAGSHLEKVKGEWRTKLPYFILKAEIFWQKGERLRAWSVLEEAQGLGLSEKVLGKKRFQYLLGQKLYQSAYEAAIHLFKEGLPKPDVLALGSQLRQENQLELSAQLLQMALLKWQKDPALVLELSQNYLSQKKKFSAALLLEETARIHQEVTFEASELLRQVGLSYRARYLNISTLEPKKKLRQKVALFLESDDYQSLNSLVPELQRERMLDNEDIRYAVAFSLFQTGDFNKSQGHLSKIVGDELFGKAVELKREIEKCEESQWSCFETL